MYEDFSPAALDVMSFASDESRALGHFYLGVEHLALGLLCTADAACNGALRAARIDRDAWLSTLRSELAPGADPLWGKQFISTPRLTWVIEVARKLARMNRATHVEPVHLLAAAALEGRGLPITVLKGLGQRPESLVTAALGGSGPAQESGAPTSNALGRYTRNLCEQARAGKLHDVIGREPELLRLAQILSRRTKSNALLVGEAGVGKTGVVHGLAQLVAGADCPPALRGKRIYELRLAALIGGTKFRGELEQRIDELIQLLRADEDAIVFVDEIHTLAGAGNSGGGLGLADALKPALADGGVRLIGATTPDELAKTIERDAALSRRFEIIRIEEPALEHVRRILQTVRERLQTHHGVVIEDAALARAIVLCDRYLGERRFPDKAIDVLDDACAQARLDTLRPDASSIGQRSVDQRAIERVVAERVDIPVEHLSRSDTQLVAELEERLRSTILGQDDAIRAVADAVRVRWVGLSDRQRPAGVFLFVGPTGVGKTELARTLASVLFGTEAKLSRLDMAEYAEAHSVSKLLGAPPGYVGYDEGGRLGEAVRRNPYGVLLLDEIEKAHPALYPVFLRVFDEGQLLDSQGRALSFRNQLIILSSNLGAGPARRRIGLGAEDEDRLQERIDKAIAEHFSAELRNRIDRTITFRPLSDPLLLQRIAALSLGRHLDNLRGERAIEVSADETLLSAIVARGTSLEFGARHIKRACFDLVVGPLSTWLVDHPLGAGSKVLLSWRDTLQIEVTDAR